MPSSRASGWGSKPEWTSAAVNTQGIIDAGQCSLWGNLIWSAIGQAILIPHHTRLSYKGTLFNIAGNVHILNTSHWRFPKPVSVAILRRKPHLGSIELVSWSAHACSSLRQRSLVLSFPLCDDWVVQKTALRNKWCYPLIYLLLFYCVIKNSQASKICFTIV